MKNLLLLAAMVGGLATVGASQSDASWRYRGGYYGGYSRPYYGGYGNNYYSPRYGYRSYYRNGWYGNRGWNNRGWGNRGWGNRGGFSIYW